jgi:hypothetical protein
MVREAVGNNRDLQVDLVMCVNSCGDPHEALYWASTYGIPKNEQPYNVQMLQEEDSGVRYGSNYILWEADCYFIETHYCYICSFVLCGKQKKNMQTTKQTPWS